MKNSKNPLFLIIATILVLTALTACGMGQNGRSHGSRAVIRNETSSDVYTYDLPGNANELTLDIDIQADLGKFRWQVTDPNGEIVWEGSLEGADQLIKNEELALIPGRWTLEVAMERASGSYDIEWRSR